MNRIPNLDKKYEKNFIIREASLAEVLAPAPKEEIHIPNLDKRYRESYQISMLSVKDILITLGMKLDEELWRLAQVCHNPWQCYRMLAEAKVSGRYDELTMLMERILAGLL